MSPLQPTTSMFCDARWECKIWLWFMNNLVFYVNFLGFLLICGSISQIHGGFRKPLVVMSPKSLLRHKLCKSNLSEFDGVEGHPGFGKQGTKFKQLIKDRNDHSDLEEGIRRLVLCSGKVFLFYFWILMMNKNNFLPFSYKCWTTRRAPLWNTLYLCRKNVAPFLVFVRWFQLCMASSINSLAILQVYYELDEERERVDGKDIAICRLEQLCPFPYDLVQRGLRRYPSMFSITGKWLPIQ